MVEIFGRFQFHPASFYKIFQSAEIDHLHGQTYRHIGAKTHSLTRDSLDFKASKMLIMWKKMISEMWILWKFGFHKGEFCKNGILEMWILWKMRFLKGEFWKN